jgi:hypothetical protein
MNHLHRASHATGVTLGGSLAPRPEFRRGVGYPHAWLYESIAPPLRQHSASQSLYRCGNRRQVQRGKGLLARRRPLWTTALHSARVGSSVDAA